MEIVIRTPNGEAEVSLDGFDDSTPLDDLAHRVLDEPGAREIAVSGRTLPGSAPLSGCGLLDGSVLELGTTVDRAADHGDGVGDDAVLELIQVAGSGAGRRRRLASGRYAIGGAAGVAQAALESGAVADPAVEVRVDQHGRCRVRTSRPAELDGVSITSARDPVDGAGDGDGNADDDATGWVDWTGGVLAVEGKAFVVRHRRDARVTRRLPPAASVGLVAFNRPPRPASAPAPAPLEVPEGGKEVGDRRRFPLLAMLAPIPIAVAIALVTQRPMFLLFGLMSPVMMFANFIEDRRTRKRDLKVSKGADAKALAEFREATTRAHAEAVARARADNPDVAAAIEVAQLAGPDLWERRPSSDDAWRVPIGLADVDWAPELTRGQRSIAAASEIVGDAGPLPMVPVTVDFGSEHGLAIVGDELAARAAARGVIVEAATLHGPADLEIVVCTDERRAPWWEWVKWLPHTRAVQPRILTNADEVKAWVTAMRGAHGKPDHRRSDERPARLSLVVSDADDRWRHRAAPLRSMLSESWLPVRWLALTDDPHAAPAPCTTVLTVGDGSSASVEYVVERRYVDGVLPFYVDPDLATDTARSMAALEDSDLPMAAEASLPTRVSHLDLLGLLEPTATAIHERWRSGSRPPTPRAPIGLGDGGPLEIDLVGDGPHALIAGTTGSGKSELLRSLVVSLAASLQPDDLNIVLVDFKGGSAFDACADLPHTVGLVTDLDEHLAGRVLRCLSAELHYREVRLREAGVSSLPEYQQLSNVTPLPRLLLVIDEFAAMAAELPDFLPALVDIAQRGRSLGVHMILATQRPQGVLDAKIKANTNLRIALRVQDDQDSADVVGTTAAAQLPRRVPGRAYARFGAGELVQFQSGYSTGFTDPDDASPLVVLPWIVGRQPTGIEHRVERRAAMATAMAARRDDETSDLVRLVDAIGRAAVELGQTSQRVPYPEPLPARLTLDELLARVPAEDDGNGDDDPGVAFALDDLPDEQRQAVRWWKPRGDGSMLVYGVTGAGTSSLLATLALGVARRYAPDDVHLYAIDADANVLAPLAGLGHAGGVVGLDDPDRVARVLRVLREEVSRRVRLSSDRGGPAGVAASEPAIVLFVDNAGALKQLTDRQSQRHGSIWDDLEQVIRDGQSVGVCVVISGKNPTAIPHAMANQFKKRLVMELGHPDSYLALGLSAKDLPSFTPGRACSVSDGVELQVAAISEPLDELVGRLDDIASVRPPVRVDPVPGEVRFTDIMSSARVFDARLDLPVGLDLSDVAPAALGLEFGESAIVAGPGRSGKSTVMAMIAHGAAVAAPSLPVFAVCSRRSVLLDVPTLHSAPAGPGDVASWVESISEMTGPRLVLVDDADRVSGPSFDRLVEIARNDDQLVAVFAGRSDELRQMGHWTRPLQRTRTGVLLRPTLADAELLRVDLGSREPRCELGHGFLCNDGEVVRLLAARLDGDQLG